MTNQDKLDYIEIKTDIEGICVQTIEELAELQQALTKYLRLVNGKAKPNSRKEIFNNIYEEVADVFLCLKVLGQFGLYSTKRVEQIADYKLDRWYNRLNGDWSE